MFTSEWKVYISTLCVPVSLSTCHRQSHGASPSPSAQSPRARQPFLTCKSPHSEEIIWGRGSDEGKGESGMNSGVRAIQSGAGRTVETQSACRVYMLIQLHKKPISCRDNQQCLLLQTVWGSLLGASSAEVNFGRIRVDWLGVTLCRFSLEKTPQLCPEQYKQHARQILSPQCKNMFTHTTECICHKWVIWTWWNHLWSCSHL